jgi:hypothetical protein
VRWSNEIYHPYATHCSWWVAGSAFIQANVIDKLRRDLLKITSPDDTIALLSNVSAEDEFLSSLGIVVGLDRLRRGKITRDEYVNKYGHRGPHEVERYFPRPAENPNWIDEQLDGLEHTPANVEMLLQEQRARYEAALKNLQKAAPRQFDTFLQRIKEAARLGIGRFDVILVSGDAYVDHPSFGTALIGRVLWDAGFTVGIVERERIIGGIITETHERLLREDHAIPHMEPDFRGWYTFAYVDPDWWGLMIFEMMAENHVNLLLHSLAVDVVKEGKAVISQSSQRTQRNPLEMYS